MANINVKVVNKLPKDEAIKKIDALFNADEAGVPEDEKIKSLRKEWSGNTCDFSFKKKGYNFDGKITVTDSAADVVLNMPGMVKMAKGNEIKRDIERKATELLS